MNYSIWDNKLEAFFSYDGMQTLYDDRKKCQSYCDTLNLCGASPGRMECVPVSIRIDNERALDAD